MKWKSPEQNLLYVREKIPLGVRMLDLHLPPEKIVTDIFINELRNQNYNK